MKWKQKHLNKQKKNIDNDHNNIIEKRLELSGERAIFNWEINLKQKLKQKKKKKNKKKEKNKETIKWKKIKKKTKKLKKRRKLNKINI